MFVISGATGNVGRPLVQALTDAGHQVTAVSRHAPPTIPDGVRHERADLADPPSLRPALDGAAAFFLLVSGAGAHLDVPAVLGEVRSAGVRRIVLLSSQAAVTRPGSVSHAPLRAAEVAVEQSGLEWTHLRPGGFTANSFAWVPAVRARRTVMAPFAEVGLPAIDPQDIADVAAAVLTRPEHGGRAYTLTGPSLTTPRERASAIGAALGEPITFVEQTRDEAFAQLSQFMPEPVVAGTLDILGAPTADEQRISPDVPAVLGRAATSYAAWAARNVAAFR